MPSWGRPYGAHKGKRGKGRDRESRQQAEARRFEEVDSDDDDGQGVGLDRSYVSDELYFTGADMGSRPRARRMTTHDYDYASDSSEHGDGDVNDGSGGTMQLALRDKEEQLVRQALERIRRAQMLGRTNVDLTQLEIDALARKRRKDESTNKALGLGLKSADRRTSGGRSNEVPKEQRLNGKKIRAPLSAYDNIETSASGRATPPGIVVPGPDDNPSYQPFDPYPPTHPKPYNRSSRSGSRSASSHGQHQSTPPLPSSQFRPPKARYFSGPEASRPPQQNLLPRRLPDDPNWIPRPRSASSNPPYPNNASPHQTYSPPLSQVRPHYPQGRRNVSGPPEMQHFSSRSGDSSPMPYAASSESSIPHREHSGDMAGEYVAISDDSDNDDDDEDYGVQVDVVPYSQSYGINVRPEDYAVGRSRRGER